MPRIRTIKPEFFRSPPVGALSPEARLLFIGMWTEADDEGRLLGSAKHLAGALFPFDEKATAGRVESWIEELVLAHLVVPYVSKGVRYFHIRSWAEHQKINRPTPSKLPDPSVSTHDLLTDDSLPERNREQGSGTGNREQGSALTRAARESNRFDDFWAVYPRRVGKGEARKCYDRRIRSGTSEEALLAGAQRYAAWVAAGGVEAMRFVAHPSTWLNQGREADDLPPPAAMNGRPKGMDAVDAVFGAARRMT